MNKFQIWCLISKMPFFYIAQLGNYMKLGFSKVEPSRLMSRIKTYHPNFTVFMWEHKDPKAVKRLVKSSLKSKEGSQVCYKPHSLKHSNAFDLFWKTKYDVTPKYSKDPKDVSAGNPNGNQGENQMVPSFYMQQARQAADGMEGTRFLGTMSFNSGNIKMPK